MQCDAYNKIPGKLTGYDCPECMNRGFTAIAKDGDFVLKECRCAPVRRSIQNIERSGLKDLLERCTLENYQVEEGWQRIISDAAKRFLRDHDGKWFYIGGQVGAGKTHICTAIVGELLKSGLPAKYMLWTDEANRLKANIMDDSFYSQKMEKLKNVKVLYIDDFFKPVKERVYMDGKYVSKTKSPSAAEIKIAFELLNNRYGRKDLITIISSELKVDDILSIDEGVGSRIYQRTKEFCMSIPKDAKKNYRLR